MNTSSRIPSSEPKFFMVYSPEHKNFIRVNFQDPRRKEAARKKFTQPDATPGIRNMGVVVDDICLP